MRSLCLNFFVALGLVFTLTSQSFAGNWVFEKSTDSSDGRKGVIIYKSDHFDTTPGAFARFIVLDNNTLRLRLRTTASGPMYQIPDVDFAIPKGDGTDFAGIYYPAKDGSKCVAEPEIATGCRLTCARTYEDFGPGDDVACSTKSDSNLWIDFRASITPEHTDRILETYPGLTKINFFAGMNDDATDGTSWYLNADDLLKNICEQTKALDHACRGETVVSAASTEPEQEAVAEVEKPVCDFRENDIGGFFVYADDEEWRVQIGNHNQSSDQNKSLFGIKKPAGYDSTKIEILLDNGSMSSLEFWAETDISYSGKNFNWSASTNVGFNDDDYSDYFWAFEFNIGDAEKLEKLISDLDEKGDVEIAAGYSDSDEAIFELTYPLRGLPVAVSLAKSRYESLLADLRNGNCMAVSDYYDDDDDW